jgi:hypothetical protein
MKLLKGLFRLDASKLPAAYEEKVLFIHGKLGEQLVANRAFGVSLKPIRKTQK